MLNLSNFHILESLFSREGEANKRKVGGGGGGGGSWGERAVVVQKTNNGKSGIKNWQLLANALFGRHLTKIIFLNMFEENVNCVMSQENVAKTQNKQKGQPL